MWHEITPSAFPWERAALDHIKQLLPDRPAFQAWSNFTFMSAQGHLREGRPAGGNAERPAPPRDQELQGDADQ